jgi:hypothetical protein
MSIKNNYILNSISQYKDVIIIAAFSMLYAFLFLRIVGAQEVAAGDELTHKLLSYRDSNTISAISGYLFYDIYSLTKFCNYQSYICVKFFNWIFLILSSLIIYLFANTYLKLSKFSIVFILLSFALAQQSIYSSFFTPDALYSFVCLIFFIVLIVTTNSKNNNYSNSFFLGLSIACASLVKPHGVFLLGFYFLYLITSALLKISSQSHRQMFLNFLFVTLSFLVLRNFYIYFSQSLFDLSLFGSSYTGHLPSEFNISILTKILFGATYVFLNHITWVALIYSLPFFLFTLVLLDKKSSYEERNFSLISLLSIFYFMFIVAFFTSLVNYTQGGSESLSRMHTRYYYFLYPILIISFFKIKDSYLPNLNKVFYLASTYTFLFLISSFYFIYNVSGSISQSLMDNPDIHGLLWLKDYSFIFYSFLFLALLPFAIYFIDKKMAFKLYLFFYSIFILSGILISTRDLQGMSIYDNTWGSYSYCGDLLKLLSRDKDIKNANLWVSGENVMDAHHLGFHSDSAISKFIEFKDGDRYQAEWQNNDKDILLVEINPALNYGFRNGKIIFSNSTCSFIFKKAR